MSVEESIVTRWLQRIGVEENAQKFFNEGFRDLKQASGVEKADLVSMRVEKIQHDYILEKVTELKVKLHKKKKKFDLCADIPQVEPVFLETGVEVKEKDTELEEEGETDLFNKKNDEKRYGNEHQDAHTTQLSALIQKRPYMLVLCAPLIWPCLPMLLVEECCPCIWPCIEPISQPIYQLFRDLLDGLVYSIIRSVDYNGVK